MTKQQKMSSYKAPQSLKFALVMIMFMIFMLSFASALDFDNSKSYDAVAKEVVITNAFGMGSELGSIKLIKRVLN